MDVYVSKLKDKLISCNNDLVATNNEIDKLKDSINSYLKSEEFSCSSFINNNSIKTSIKKLVSDKKLLSYFERLISELSKVGYVKLSSRTDARVNRKKLELQEVLRKILKHLEENKVKYYLNLDERLKVLDKIGTESVLIEKDFNFMMKNLGFSNTEILEFNAFVVKQNMNIYKEKVKQIDAESLRMEEELIKKALNKEARMHKKHVFSKEKSAFANNLINTADTLTKVLSEYTEKDKNMALAYYELMLGDVNEITASIYDSNSLLKYLLINILNISTYIKEKENICTEEELSNELGKLKKLCDNYKILKSFENVNSNYIDDNEVVNNNMNVHYVYDSKTNNSYLNKDIEKNKADGGYVKNAKLLIEKLEKGKFNLKTKKSIHGIPNCFYLQQGVTYVSIIVVSNDNYIVLTSSKWKDLFQMTNNIYETEKEQIEEIEKTIIGEMK